MSVKFSRRVWKEAPVSGRPLLVLLALAEAADNKGELMCTRHDLRHKTRLNELQLAGALEQLGTQKLLAMANGNTPDRVAFTLFPGRGWART